MCSSQYMLSSTLTNTSDIRSVCIPPTDFYPPHLHDIGAQFLRIAYCKQPETIEKAGEALLKLKPYIK